MPSKALHRLWMRPQPNLAGTGYRLELIEAHHGVRAFAAVRSETNQPALVFELDREFLPKDPGSFSTRAFALEIASFPGLPAGHSAVAIFLRNPDFEDLFVKLCETTFELFQAASTPGEAATAILHNIERWRKFVESGRTGLDDKAVRGLIGELVVLARLVLKEGEARALASWKNPSANLRDFELESTSIDAKTYSADGGQRIHVSNTDQLEPGNIGKSLFVVAIELASSAEGRTLNEYVSGLAALLPADHKADFELKTAAYGYLPIHADQYRQRFAVGNISAFEVTEGFPRIKSATVPEGVLDVEFSVLLSAMRPFEKPLSLVLGATASPIEVAQ